MQAKQYLPLQSLIRHPKLCVPIPDVYAHHQGFAEQTEELSQLLVAGHGALEKTSELSRHWKNMQRTLHSLLNPVKNVKDQSLCKHFWPLTVIVGTPW